MTTETNCASCSNILGRNCVWCYRCGTYMHIKGSGLKRAKDQTQDFVCKRCCSNGSQQKEPHVAEWAVSGHPIPEPNTDANGPNSRGSYRFLDKSNLAWPEKVKFMHEKAAHWKSVFLLILEDNTGFKVVGTLNSGFSITLEKNGLSETDMTAAFLLPI